MELQKSVLKKAGLKKYFPKWQQQLVELTLTILKIIQRIHKKNILLGCIDLKTIIVKDRRQYILQKLINIKLMDIRVCPEIIFFSTGNFEV